MYVTKEMIFGGPCESPKWCVVHLRGGGVAATIGDWALIKEILAQVTPSKIESVRMGFLNNNEPPATKG